MPPTQEAIWASSRTCLSFAGTPEAPLCSPGYGRTKQPDDNPEVPARCHIGGIVMSIAACQGLPQVANTLGGTQSSITLSLQCVTSQTSPCSSVIYSPYLTALFEKIKMRLVPINKGFPMQRFRGHPSAHPLSQFNVESRTVLKMF